MGWESRPISRPRTVQALLAAAAAIVFPGTVHGFDSTFRTTLVSSFNPQSVGGSATPNYYADFGVDGNRVGLGTIVHTGVIFIDISNPLAPQKLYHYNPSLTSGGRFQDVIIRGNVAYCAVDDPASTNGGIHILDLDQLDEPPTNPLDMRIGYLSQANSGFAQNHTITLDGNYLYSQNNVNTTIKVFDVSNPAAPFWVRNIVTTGGTSENLHDATVKNGRMYTSNIDTGLLEIYNVSNVGSSAPTLLGQIPAAGIGTRNHSNSVNDEGTLVAVAHETSNGDVQLWDISNIAAPVKRATITRTSAGIDAYTPHNPVIVGDTLYVSWYHAGVQIFNIRNPSAPVHIGAYDTFVGGVGAPGGYLTNYDGNWGVNPVLGHNKVLVSDMDSGLFIVDATPALTFNWTLASDTNTWQTTANWDNGAAPMAPDGTDMVAKFTTAAAGTTRRVNVNGGAGINPVRIGRIDFSAERNYTLAPAVGTTGRIEMNVTSGTAAINLLNTGGGTPSGINRIDANLELSDDLVVTNDSTKTSQSLVLQHIFATSRTLTFKGVGQTLMQGTNAWTGSVVVDGGTVLAAQASLGASANPIFIRNGGRWIFTESATLNAARVLNVDAGIGHVEANALAALFTLSLSTTNQLRGGGTLTPAGTGALLIGAANPNFTGNVNLTSGDLTLRHAAAVNARPITLTSGWLNLRNDVGTDFASTINTSGTGTSRITVDRISAGSNVTLQLGAATVGNGHTMNVSGANGYKLAVDSLTNAGTISTSVPLVISGPLSMHGGTIGGAGNVYADGGATVSANSIRTGAGLLRVTGALTVNNGVKLDMTTSDVIVNYTGGSPEFALRDKVLLFRNGPGTQGIGFTETPAEDVILAFGEASELAISSFLGESVDATTVVGKYTYYGDANFDGMVTTDDYVAVDLGLGTGNSWVQGDFDLNGVVTTDDYVVVDLNLGKGSTNPLAFAQEQADMIALHTEMFGQSYVDKLAYASEHGWVAASVPEPAGASIVAGGAALALVGETTSPR